MLVGSLCWTVKELESESTIQTTASPSLTLTQQHKGWEKNKHTFQRKKKKKKNHCKQ